MLNRRSLLRAITGAFVAAPAVAVAGPSIPPMVLPGGIKVMREIEDAILAPARGVIWVTYGKASPHNQVSQVEHIGDLDDLPVMALYKWEGDYGRVEAVLRNDPNSPAHTVHLGPTISIVRKICAPIIVVRDPERFEGNEGDVVALLFTRTVGYPDGKVVVFAKGAPPDWLASARHCHHITLPGA